MQMCQCKESEIGSWDDHNTCRTGKEDSKGRHASFIIAIVLSQTIRDETLPIIDYTRTNCHNKFRWIVIYHGYNKARCVPSVSYVPGWIST